MSSYSLKALSREYQKDKARFVERFPHPFLLWTPPHDSVDGPILKTFVGKISEISKADNDNEPCEALEIAKGDKPNAFPFGVTIGHSENNDIVLRQRFVSRFHAYIQERGGRHLLFDAGSRNGTFIGGQKLAPLAPQPLSDGQAIDFGGSKAWFVSPQRLVNYLDRH